MIRKIAKTGALALGGLVAVTAILYAFGLRIQLDGGGTPRLRFLESSSTRAEEIARHREAQRRQPAPAPAPAPATAVVAEAEAEKAVASAGRPALDARATRDAASSVYWTDFRGPARDGHYRQHPILLDWPAGGPTLLWKQPVGAGHASFVIARRRAFTIEQRGPEEVVAAYDVQTGRELWTTAWAARFSESMGGEGPRATPTWSDGRVYALGGTGELRVLDETTGRTYWRTNILTDANATNLQWGMAASPLVVDDVVIVLPGGGNGRSVVAYQKDTGKRVWSTLDDQQSYSSPMLVTLAGVRQVLAFSASRLVGLAPDSGTLLWEYPWKTPYDVNASQPLVLDGNRVFLSTGYSTGAALIEVASTGSGLVPREVWRTNRMKNQFTSSVLHQGFIYGLDESILACLDASSGELKWKGGRYGYGQVLLASGHLIVLTEGGELALVRASPDRHQELTRVPAIDGRTWNHPAMSDGYLLIRNGREMAGLDLRTGRRQ